MSAIAVGARVLNLPQRRQPVPAAARSGDPEHERHPPDSTCCHGHSQNEKGRWQPGIHSGEHRLGLYSISLAPPTRSMPKSGSELRPLDPATGTWFQAPTALPTNARSRTSWPWQRPSRSTASIRCPTANQPSGSSQFATSRDHSRADCLDPPYSQRDSRWRGHGCPGPQEQPHLPID
jgi:hypothetical protein